jgi:hypothetical protein
VNGTSDRVPRVAACPYNAKALDGRNSCPRQGQELVSSTAEKQRKFILVQQALFPLHRVILNVFDSYSSMLAKNLY